MTTFQMIQHGCFVFTVIEFTIGFILSGMEIYRAYKKPAKTKKQIKYDWIDYNKVRELKNEESKRNGWISR